MRQSQIAAAEADYKTNPRAGHRFERADIVAYPVAYGVIHVMEDTN